MVFPAPDNFLKQLRDSYFITAKLRKTQLLPSSILESAFRPIESVYRSNFIAEPINQQIQADPRKTLVAFVVVCVDALIAHSTSLSSLFFNEQPRSYFSTSREVELDYWRFAGVFRDRGVELEAIGIRARQYPVFLSEFIEPLPRFDETKPQFTEWEPADPDDKRYWRNRKADHARELAEWRDRERDFEDTEVAAWKERKKQYDELRKSWQKNKDQFYDKFIGTPFLNESFERTITLTQPFHLPDKFRFDGTWIIAPPDSGKTTFISTMIANDLKRVSRNECSIFVMDSQNELIPDIAKLNVFAPGQPLHGRLIYLEPSSTYPLALNIFDTQQSRFANLTDDDRMMVENGAISMIEFFLKSLVKSEETSHQETYLQFVIPAVMAIPDATLFTLMDLLEPPPNKLSPPPGYEKYKHHFGHLRDRVQTWLRDRMHSPQLSLTRDAIRARIEGIYARSFFHDMMVHPRNKFDFFTELQSAKVILVNTKKGLLKTDTEPFGRYFIARLLQAAEERMLIDRGKRLPVYAYIDEASDYLADEENIEELIAKARKQKVAIVVANQYESQIKLASAHDALGKAAIQCRGRPAPHGEPPPWQISINDGEPVNVIVPETIFQDMPHISDADFEILRDDMRRRFSSVIPRDPSEPPDPVNSNANYDVDWSAEISPKLAETGGSKTIFGLIVQVRPGIRNGDRVRLRGQGARRPDGTMGDAILTFTVRGQSDQTVLGGDAGYDNDENNVRPGAPKWKNS